MNSLADRLDALAQEATGPVEAVPPELALRSRHRHRLKVATGGIAAAFLAAGASYAAFAAQSGPSRVVKVATPPGQPSPSSAAHGPQPPAADVYRQIARIAGQAAAQYEDPSPRTAVVVSTSRAAFVTAIYGTTPKPGTLTEPVYFVAMTGQFTCSTCYDPHGRSVTGTLLGLAIDQHTLATMQTVLSTHTADLSRLGQVRRLDVTGLFPAKTTTPPVMTPPPAMGAPPCQASQLTTTAVPAGVGLGHVAVNLLFTNTSTEACALSGYPGVAGVDSAGRQVTVAQHTPDGYLGGLSNGNVTPPLVTLAHGQTASAKVEGTDVPPGTQTSCPSITRLLVTAPNTSRPITVNVAPPDCSGLEVHPVVSGTTGNQQARPAP